MPRPSCALAVVVIAVAAGSCAGTETPAASVTADSVATSMDVPATTSAPGSSGETGTTTGSEPAATVGSTTSPVATPEASAVELCAFETTLVRGQVTNPALDEASGLVASRRHRDVLWAHNDGNELVGLFALGTDGSDLGFHPVMIDGVRDAEDIALSSGPSGDEILLADIGDNGANRPSIRVYRFAEPDPAVLAPITDVEVLEFVYPDRPHNAETLLVDDAAGRIVVVTKQQQRIEGVPPELWPTAPSLVFDGPLDGHAGRPVELTEVGTLDTPLLESRTVADPPHPASILGIGGMPTGGDVSPDGALIALRTYETIWLWSRPPDRSVAESLAAEPCQVKVAPERQGEAVAFRDGTLWTLSEGVNPSLFELGP